MVNGYPPELFLNNLIFFKSTCQHFENDHRNLSEPVLLSPGVGPRGDSGEGTSSAVPREETYALVQIMQVAELA